MDPAPALDAVDRRLLHRLGEDAVPDLSEVAAQVGTTVEDARARYARLRSSGLVTGCAARIEPAAVGVGCTAFLLVRVAQAADTYDVVRRMLADLEAVEEAHAVSGEADWLLKVRVPSLADVQALVARRLPLVPGFVRAQVCVVLDTARDAVNADTVRFGA